MSKIIAENENYNVWEINNKIFIAPKYSTIDTQGNPTAGRYECELNHWNIYRDTAYKNFTDKD